MLGYKYKLLHLTSDCSLQYAVHNALYHGLAIYAEETLVNVTLVEAGLSGGRPAVV